MIISFVNQKGGVGKTTSCINIGACLGEYGYDVLLVDSDSQGNLTTGCGIDKKNVYFTFIDTITSGIEIERAILTTPWSDFVDISPATVDLIGFDIQFARHENKNYLLKNAIISKKSKYDFILIDAPPSLGLLTINALAVSDYVIIPLQCEFFALEGLAQLVTTIELVKQSINTNLKILGIILNMYDARLKLAHEIKADVEKYFGSSVFKTLIPRSVRAAEAPSFGIPVINYAPNSAITYSFYQLTDEILEAIKK
ncbi:MAG: ParA family protein [bacterium]|nr:ParA family protein [bacterium]